MTTAEADNGDSEQRRRLDMVTSVVSAFISNNQLNQAELTKLIADVNKAFSDIDYIIHAAEPVVLQPAVPIKRSVTKEHIICLEDGLKFRALKRHLQVKYNLSPDEYRKKWGLPADYPMVSSAYSAARSKLAKESGLGQVRRKAQVGKTAAKASRKAAAKKPVRAKKQ